MPKCVAGELMCSLRSLAGLSGGTMIERWDGKGGIVQKDMFHNHPENNVIYRNC